MKNLTDLKFKTFTFEKDAKTEKEAQKDLKQSYLYSASYVILYKQALAEMSFASDTKSQETGAEIKEAIEAYEEDMEKLRELITDFNEPEIALIDEDFRIEFGKNMGFEEKISELNDGRPVCIFIREIVNKMSGLFDLAMLSVASGEINDKERDLLNKMLVLSKYKARYCQ